MKLLSYLDNDAIALPLTLKAASRLVEELEDEVFTPSPLEGYSLVVRESDYGGVPQRWVVICSQLRRQSDLKQLEKHLEKQSQRAQKQLRQLQQQTFACEADAQQAAQQLAAKWRWHQLAALTIKAQAHHAKAGRPAQGQSPSHYSYHVEAQVESSPETMAVAWAAGRTLSLGHE